MQLENYRFIQAVSEGGHIVIGSQSGVNAICTVWPHPRLRKSSTLISVLVELDEEIDTTFRSVC